MSLNLNCNFYLHIHISEPLKIDIKSLEIHFYEHKSTYLYVNKHNFDNFYFDLDFLNSYKHHEKSFLF